MTRPCLIPCSMSWRLCLARQFPASSANQLLLDVTELMRSDGKSGIQRVVKSLLLAFMSDPPAGLDVSAIYFDGQQFRHAQEFVQGLAGAPDGRSGLVDWRPGDIYLSLDLNIRSMPETEPLMRDLARQGVRLCFVVFDLLPLFRPDWWPTGMSARFEVWLRRLLGVADTVCCISQSVATELEAWMNGAALSFQYRRPAVHWFHLGADSGAQCALDRVARGVCDSHCRDGGKTDLFDGGHAGAAQGPRPSVNRLSRRCGLTDTL